ncbi:MAG TPA: PPE domain-containing protein [Acidimicrobiales bacterium]|nr:PPE domain-containing protein [Acidimicrobiales bacterium]
MRARLSRWAMGCVVACGVGLLGSGPAGAQPSKATFCTDLSRVAKADAAALQHPTAHDVHQLAADVRAASAAVPPTVVAANRSQLTRLVATNLLGHNVPAIIAAEAQYEQMWAQDVAGMLGYGGTSSSPSVDDKLAPVANEVEHACPGSVEVFQGLDASDHLHLTPVQSP